MALPAQGLVALCSDGLLVQFGRLENGNITGWQLYLSSSVEGGRAVLKNGSGGSADVEVYENGMSERFDAWSDNSRPHEEPWLKWVAGWVEHIGRPPRR
jgi:hypothetical protein